MSHQQVQRYPERMISGEVVAAKDAAGLADRSHGDVAHWTELDAPASAAASKEADVDVRPRGSSSLAKTDTTAVEPGSSPGISTTDLLALAYAVRRAQRGVCRGNHTSA